MSLSAAVERLQQRGLAGVLRRCLLAGAMCVAAAGAWAGPTVSYTAVDLADGDPANPPGDFWQYDYTITAPIDPFGGITLLFSYGAYTHLFSFLPDPVDPNLSLGFDVDPDPVLGDGVVVLTTTNGLTGGETAKFSVQFIWTGTGTPGSQDYTVISGPGNTDPIDGTFRTIAATNPGTVPEPAGLVLAALLALAATTTTRQRRKA